MFFTAFDIWLLVLGLLFVAWVGLRLRAMSAPRQPRRVAIDAQLRNPAEHAFAVGIGGRRREDHGFVDSVAAIDAVHG